MPFYSLKYFVLLLIISAIVSCNKNQNDLSAKNEKDSVSKVNTQKSIENTNNTQDTVLNLSWEFEFLGTGEYEVPINNVYVIVNGQKHFIVKDHYAFSEMPVSNYDYPEKVLLACRGWWAGAGVDYWVIKKNKFELIIMTQEIGESSDEKGNPDSFIGKPEKFKTINLIK
jgi:hypothetical protein